MEPIPQSNGQAGFKPYNQAPGSAANFGRKTFYVSDYQKQKQEKEWQLGFRGGQAPAYQMNDSRSMFTKPRALSRQADAHIKIEVHRDETIKNHLQREQRENMNLMFYDFNGSTQQPQSSTGQNFYQSSGLRQNYRVEGDRLPTRERGYRSAQQNLRKRAMQSEGDNQY